MNNCYTEACPKIAAYRSAYAGKKKGFHIKLSDIGDMAVEVGSNIDGIRFYFALDAGGDFEVFYVATVKDANGNYNDVNSTNATGKLRPCPLMCDTTNSAFS